MTYVGFTSTGLVRHGYNVQQVDAFLRRIEQTLSGDADRPVTARDLVTASFRRVLPLRRGYLRAEVDAFLQEVAPAVIRASAQLYSIYAGHAGQPTQRSAQPTQRSAQPTQRRAGR